MIEDHDQHWHEPPRNGEWNDLGALQAAFARRAAEQEADDRFKSFSRLMWLGVVLIALGLGVYVWSAS